MKLEMQIIEDYIDYLGDRDFVNSLTIPEKTLYKCQLRDTLGFAKFALCIRWKQLCEEMTEQLKR